MSQVIAQAQQFCKVLNDETIKILIRKHLDLFSYVSKTYL